MMNIRGDMTSGALSTALIQLRAHGERLDRAAGRIAAGSDDLIGDLVEMAQARAAYEVGLAVVGVGMDVERSVLDVLV